MPRFVLRELQHIADSSDALRRARGRRGLDILNKLQKDATVPLVIHEDDGEPGVEVDALLVMLARRLRCPIVTNDYNLNRVAGLQGIKVLNVNELANAVKSIVLPGQEMSLKVIQEGKEVGQGVGYLEDGTMVVVENGRRAVGSTVTVLVSRVLQTAAGRMVFAQTRSSVARATARCDAVIGGEPVGAILVAAGRSTRMGFDKLWADLGRAAGPGLEPVGAGEPARRLIDSSSSAPTIVSTRSGGWSGRTVPARFEAGRTGRRASPRLGRGRPRGARRLSMGTRPRRRAPVPDRPADRARARRGHGDRAPAWPPCRPVTPSSGSARTAPCWRRRDREELWTVQTPQLFRTRSGAATRSPRPTTTRPTRRHWSSGSGARSASSRATPCASRSPRRTTWRSLGRCWRSGQAGSPVTEPPSPPELC